MKVASVLVPASLVLLGSIPAGLSQTTSTRVGTVILRTVPLTIKVVLLGFNPRVVIDFGLVSRQIESARSMLDNALVKYGSMQYVLAVEMAQRADQSANSALVTFLLAPSWAVAVLISLVLGIALGSFLIFIAMSDYSKKIYERW